MYDETAKRLAELEQRIESMDTCIKQIRHDTGDIVDMFKALSGGLKVLKWLGTLAAPVVAITAAWTAIKTGVSK